LDILHGKNTSFEAACGPKNLMEILKIFRKWAEDEG
jgi:hypothetical protein